jgi:ABC-2 type transport system permease protein
VTAAQIRFFSLVRREVNRFLKIKRQTVGAPLLETFLYISVFGAALGSRIDKLHGIDYVVFVIPGLIMMAWAINAFANNSSSILQQKFQRAIDDQLSSPASPLELLLAFSLGGFLRGMLVATLTFAAASVLVDLPVDHVLVLVPALLLVGFFFAQLGVLVGVRAEQFDDVSFAQTFVLQPLIFLGGVFYSAALLPEPFQTLTHFNPIYYMINLVRYGFLGYTEANVALSLLLLTLAIAWWRTDLYALLLAHYGLSLAGVIFEIYFLYIQVFVLGAVCIWCTSYGVSLIARFVIALVVWMRGTPTVIAES